MIHLLPIGSENIYIFLNAGLRLCKKHLPMKQKKEAARLDWLVVLFFLTALTGAVSLVETKQGEVSGHTFVFWLALAFFYLAINYFRWVEPRSRASWLVAAANFILWPAILVQSQYETDLLSGVVIMAGFFILAIVAISKGEAARQE